MLQGLQFLVDIVGSHKYISEYKLYVYFLFCSVEETFLVGFIIFILREMCVLRKHFKTLHGQFNRYITFRSERLRSCNKGQQVLIRFIGFDVSDYFRI